jgi:hypothetical protein
MHMQTAPSAETPHQSGRPQIGQGDAEFTRTQLLRASISAAH